MSTRARTPLPKAISGCNHKPENAGTSVEERRFLQGIFKRHCRSLASVPCSLVRSQLDSQLDAEVFIAPKHLQCLKKLERKPMPLRWLMTCRQRASDSVPSRVAEVHAPVNNLTELLNFLIQPSCHLFDFPSAANGKPIRPPTHGLRLTWLLPVSCYLPLPSSWLPHGESLRLISLRARQTVPDANTALAPLGFSLLHRNAMRVGIRILPDASHLPGNFRSRLASGNLESDCPRFPPRHTGWARVRRSK